MWVKIKSTKIPNMILEVPYSAYLNSFNKKGFVLVDKDIKNKDNVKNKTDTIIQNKDNGVDLKLDDYEINALNELKNSVNDTSVLWETSDNEIIIEDKINIVNTEKQKPNTEKPKDTEIPVRNPVKKPSIAKR